MAEDEDVVGTWNEEKSRRGQVSSSTVSSDCWKTQQVITTAKGS